MPPNPYEDPHGDSLHNKRQQAQMALEKMVGRGELTLAGYSDRADMIWSTQDATELDKIIHESRTTEVEAYVDPLAPVLQPSGWQIVSDVKRQGQFRLPAYTKWNSVMGDVKLDLREALVEQRVVELDLNLIFADMTLIVPAGTDIHWDVQTILGDQKMRHGREDTFGGFINRLIGGPKGGIMGREVVKASRPAQRLVVRITGRTFAGDINVRVLDDMEPAPLF